MIEALLPTPVRSAEAFGDPPDATLLPEEVPFVERASAGRRAEFTTTRWCARRALAGLGLPPAPLLVGDQGAPCWPERVVGSLTHCDGYRAAAVARTDDVLAIGIDAEPHVPLPAKVEPVVVGSDERRHLDALGRSHPDVHWGRLLFSAKESTYKAWFPLARRWLGFRDVLVTFDPDARAFTTSILVPGPLTTVTGRWDVLGPVVVTAISVPR